jgi:hypothetical protein
VFDPQSTRFVSNDLTRALGTVTANDLELDAARHDIVADHFQAVCGGTADIYHVEEGRRLVLMHQETIVPEEDGSCTVTIRDRINGQMHVKTVRRRQLQ